MFLFWNAFWFHVRKWNFLIFLINNINKLLTRPFNVFCYVLWFHTTQFTMSLLHLRWQQPQLVTAIETSNHTTVLPVIHIHHHKVLPSKHHMKYIMYIKYIFIHYYHKNLISILSLILFGIRKIGFISGGVYNNIVSV